MLIRVTEIQVMHVMCVSSSEQSANTAGERERERERKANTIRAEGSFRLLSLSLSCHEEHFMCLNH